MHSCEAETPIIQGKSPVKVHDLSPAKVLLTAQNHPFFQDDAGCQTPADL